VAAELRRFLLAAPEAWRPVWIAGVFTGLRPGELQAMRWTDQNWPDFTSNKIHVTTAYKVKSKTLGAPKTDRSILDVDMVPTVRQALLALPSRAAGGLVFPGPRGGVLPPTTMKRAWVRTIKAAKIRPLRPYDLRHTLASLLIAAGKNPLYIARQMGHYSAGFTLDTYGHLMDWLPKRQVEWIDELVFPEGFAAALNLHLSGAPQGAARCSPVQPPEVLDPLINMTGRSLVQSGATGELAGAEGLEPPTTGFGDRRSTKLSYAPSVNRLTGPSISSAFPCVQCASGTTGSISRARADRAYSSCSS
jgi:integrase-like protein